MVSFNSYMSTKAVALAVFVLTALVSPALAQHADIEFTYTNNKLDVQFGPEGQVFESEFPTDGAFEQFTDDPGFASEAAEGLGVNPNDTIDYNIVGPLMFHNGTSLDAVPTGAQILISDNPGGSLTVTDSTSGPVSGDGVIAQADGGGDIHAHIDFTLQPGEFDTGNNPPAGAYGLLMELTTDTVGIANSDPFFIVFNFGLAEQVFEGAVEAFAAAVPEPASLAVVTFGGLFLIARRRWVRT